MAGEKREKAIGAFVIGGVLLIFAAFVWLASAEFLHGGKTYVSYFDHPVGALDKGSSVKYMGLEIGTVKSIDVSPDPELIGVVFRVRRPELVTDRTAAHIGSVGFTGVCFVQLVHVAADTRIDTPELDFEAPHAVIPSQPSSMDSLMGTAQRVADQLASLKLADTLSSIRGAAESARDLLSSSEVATTLDNVATASLRVAESARRLDELMANDSLADVPGELATTISQTRRLVEDVSEQLESLDLGQTSRHVDDLLVTAESQGRTVSLQVEALIRDLRRTSDTLDQLLLRLKNDPSELLFGKPAPERRPR